MICVLLDIHLKRMGKIASILSARAAAAAAEAAAQAIRQKQIQQQQQEMTVRKIPPQNSSQDNDVFITSPPITSNDNVFSQASYMTKGSVSQPPRVMASSQGPSSIHSGYQQQHKPEPKSNDQLLLNLLNSNNSSLGQNPANKAKQNKGSKKRKAMSSLDLAMPPGAMINPDEPPGGMGFASGKSPKQRRVVAGAVQD
jgi:hypothetical protein